MTLARCGTLVCVVSLLAWANPASASYAMYGKVGNHAQYMQNYKNSAKDFINSVNTLATNLGLDVQALNATLQNSFTTAETELNVLSQMADDLNERLDEFIANQTQPPTFRTPSAFQALMDDGADMVVSPSLPIKYEDVLLNEGGHYDSNTGLFTAPEAGLYWFHASFSPIAAPPVTKYLGVMKVHRNTGSSYAIARVKYYVSQETACTTVARLRAGETVGMYATGITVSTWSFRDGHDNSFSGYKIADYDDSNDAPDPTTTTTTTTTTTPSNSSSTDESTSSPSSSTSS